MTDYSNVKALKVLEGGMLEHSIVGRVDSKTWADNIGRVLVDSGRIETVVGWGYMDGDLCVLVDEVGRDAYYVRPSAIGHGGARPGAGRPAAMKDAKRVNLMLDAETIAKASALGNGNVSAGVRSAVAFAFDQNPPTLTGEPDQ